MWILMMMVAARWFHDTSFQIIMKRDVDIRKRVMRPCRVVKRHDLHEVRRRYPQRVIRLCRVAARPVPRYFMNFEGIDGVVSSTTKKKGGCTDSVWIGGSIFFLPSLDSFFTVAHERTIAARRVQFPTCHSVRHQKKKKRKVAWVTKKRQLGSANKNGIWSQQGRRAVRTEEEEKDEDEDEDEDYQDSSSEYGTLVTVKHHTYVFCRQRVSPVDTAAARYC